MPLYTVSQITSYLKEALERDALLGDLWVSGEVSNFTRSAVGHMYFTLKDGESQLRCVMFRNGNGGETMANGVAVAAHGRISFYEVRGELQFYVDLVRPEGMGELHLELERLKVRLEAEGLFEPSRKRPIPRFPERIGVVTSPVGAVWQDIQTVVGRRYPLVELTLAPCNVQGDRAAPSILEAFQLLNQESDVDTVIVARGGGSLEELWPFNEEVVARAIYASRCPVISAVGHETDFTIADLVADLRAPTPSAAAELAVPDSRDLHSTVLQDVHTLIDGIGEWLTAQSVNVERLSQRLSSRTPDTGTWRQRVDDALQATGLRLNSSLALHKERLHSLQGRLVSLNPRAVLERGYAVVQQETTGAMVTSVDDVAPEDRLRVHVQDGAFGAKVVGGDPGQAGVRTRSRRRASRTR